MPQRRHNLPGLLDLHLAVLLFGFAGLFGRFLVLRPTVIVFGRSAFASAALLLFLRIRRERLLPTSSTTFAWLALSGAILALHWVSFFQAVQVSSVAIALLTYSTFPLFVTFLEPWVARESLRGVDVMTAMFVVAGMVCVVPRFDLSDHDAAGACWGVLSGFTFAVLSLMNRHLVRNCTPILLAGWQNCFAALCLAALLPWRRLSLTAHDLALLAVLGLLCTALAHALFIKGLASVRAQFAGVISALEAAYGILLAFLMLGEKPGCRTLAGGALILGGVALGTAMRKRDEPAEEIPRRKIL